MVRYIHRKSLIVRSIKTKPAYEKSRGILEQWSLVLLSQGFSLSGSG